MADEITYLEAITAGLAGALRDDARVFCIGEDIGHFGGAFGVTKGLLDEFGPERIIDTPISEEAFVGAAMGAAWMGERPIVELQFADFVACPFDQIVTVVAKTHWRSGIALPMVIRMPGGAGVRGGPYHSQSPEGWFVGEAGLKVVCPGTVADAYGLLRSAIEDDDPVIFFEPKRIYNGPFDGDPAKPAVGWDQHPMGEVPLDYYQVPIGKAAIARAGSAVTIVTYGTMVHVCAAAAADLGIDAEIVDVRTMVPLDIDTLAASVNKTGRCLIAHEATRFAGFGAELSASIQEACFWRLEAPIARVAGWDTPYPHAFEWEYFPGRARVRMALESLMKTA